MMPYTYCVKSCLKFVKHRVWAGEAVAGVHRSMTPALCCAGGLLLFMLKLLAIAR